MKKTLTLAALLGAGLSGANGQLLVNSDITVDTIWGDDVNEDYVVLDQAIFVKNDATLTILPGTIVRGQPRRAAGGGPGAEPGSLIITQSGRIDAQGTVSDPIVFTTAAIDNNTDNIPDGTTFMSPWTSGSDTFYDDDPIGDPLGQTAAGPIPNNATSSDEHDFLLNNDNTQLWGGLIILGEAPTNLDNGTDPVGQGRIEGLPPTADTLFGGSLANDDSGILRYVSVRHGGEAIGTGNEINGITIGGVGFGTIMEYVEVYMNYDDGFEWFGGTVNGRYLTASYIGDDSFDGDLGWVGQVQYTLTVQAFTAVGISGGDEAFEFDGDDSPEVNEDLGGNIVPFPAYSFANFTIVGPEGATGYTGIYNASTNQNGVKANGRITLRNGFNGELYNGYIVNSQGSFLSFGSGVTGLLDTITIDDSTDTVVPTATGLTTANIVLPANASGLIGEDQGIAGGLDPRPFITLGTQGVTSGITLPGGFETELYVGAFPASTSVDLWTTGWTAINRSGILVD